MRLKWRQEGNTVAGPVSCAVALFGCLLLIGTIVRYNKPKVEPIKPCESATCQLYVQAVNFSLLPGVEPCRDFYQHVCGGWLRRRSDTVRERLLATFSERVTRFARRTFVPAQFQSPKQRAAMAYTSCADMVSRAYKEEKEIEGVLRSSGLHWPHQTPASNPLSTLLYLCQNWGVAFLVDMHLVGHHRYVVEPTSMYAELLLLRDRIKRHKELFDALRQRYAKDQASQVSYLRQIQLENETLSALRESFDNASAPDLELRGSDVWESLVEQADANVSRYLWRDALRDRLEVDEDPSIRVVVKRPEFVRRIVHLPSRLGGEGFALAMGWIVVQLFSLLTDSQAMRRFYNRGSPDDIEEAQRITCLRIVQENMGFAFNAEYVDEVGTRDALKEVAGIVQRVSRAFREQIRRSPALQDVQVPSYDNKTGALFRYLDRSREEYLRHAFHTYTDMSPLLVLSLEVISKGSTTVIIIIIRVLSNHMLSAEYF
ncbi:neprilysin-1-like [Amblyomma americanum]